MTQKNAANQSPPRLPDQWNTSYISYWQPILEEDQITSGYCWFDYKRGICRIDGLFNPWSERETGYRLWMSETANVAERLTRKCRIAYTKEECADTAVYAAQPLDDTLDECMALLLAQDVLIEYQASFAGRHTVLGITTDAWTFTKPGKGPATYYFKSDSGHLVRMVTGDPAVHASVRDFPNFNTHDIPAWIFDT